MFTYLLGFMLLTGCGKVQFVFHFTNSGGDNAHLIVSGQETANEDNKVEVGGTREYVVFEEGEDSGSPTMDFVVEAWRGEVLLASAECPEAQGDTDFDVVFTEDSGPAISCGT